mgnify:CR=1 FL=1
MEYNELFTYSDGNLYRKARVIKDLRVDRSWNSQWAGTLAGHTTKGGRRTVKCNSKDVLAHRVIWEMHNGSIPKNMQIHHINANPLDNRIENLSLVTNKQNHNKSDRWGKGWKLTRHGHYQSSAIPSKTFHTICGAVMHTRMQHVS